MIEVWAPRAKQVDVVLEGGARHPLAADEDSGWFRGGPELDHGATYRFSLDGAEPLADPRSRWQPDGYDGPSAVWDARRFPWTDAGWHGFHLPGSVLYELHVGTFSREGTFDGAIAHLDDLVELGVDAIEVMPVAEFPGRRGWGYDGVLLYAPHHYYGGPDGLDRLVDAAHERGLGVVLDVVYNHLGPVGNYLDRFGPYFTDRHSTPWGAAVNLDGEDAGEVRRFLIGNALYWLRDHHFDGLRLDAVHALVDDSAQHFLEELAVEVRTLAAHLGRPLWVIAETDRNDPRPVTPREAGGYGLDAQWSDDLHHALHAALTGEGDGYYADYGGLSPVARALENVFVLDGGYSGFRRRRHGRPAGTLDRHRFVVATQNHDQVGNRARGERLSHLAGIDAALAAAAFVLCGPFVPMLFQGEEWCAGSPFPWFCDLPGDDLREAVRRGRVEEFSAFGWDPEDIPDPLAVETAASAVLRWDEREEPEHRRALEWYRTMLRLRRSRPDLTAGDPFSVATAVDPAGRWLVMRRTSTAVAYNASDDAVGVPVDATGNATGVIVATGEAQLGAGVEPLRLGAGVTAILELPA